MFHLFKIFNKIFQFNQTSIQPYVHSFQNKKYIQKTTLSKQTPVYSIKFFFFQKPKSNPSIHVFSPPETLISSCMPSCEKKPKTRCRILFTYCHDGLTLVSVILQGILSIYFDCYISALICKVFKEMNIIFSISAEEKKISKTLL